MKLTYTDLAKELKAKNIRLSHQRLKVLEYLNSHMTHPTVEQIFAGLQNEVPSLSKTTVYNTLSALEAAGMVRAVNIEDNETRYDVNVEDHGHFKCESCGTIYDFETDIGSLQTHELDGFDVKDKQVYFKGKCPNCLK